MQIRYAQSLGGGFEGHPKDVWGCSDYVDKNKPVVFCGMYDLRDYYALWKHKGKVYVFWCGSDIRNLVNGFVFNDGKLKWLSKLCPGFKFLVKHILEKAEHWCENHVERDALLKWGIEVVYVTPSYFGKVDIPITYKHSKNPEVYISCSKGRQKEYGFDIIERVAPQCPQITFHLYGDKWLTKHKNVISHGRVPIEQMNKETEDMQCSLRLNEFDGFSEITAKAILRGQYAITKIKYPQIPTYKNDKELIELLRSLSITYESCPARDMYRHFINKFPFNAKLF